MNNYIRTVCEINGLKYISSKPVSGGDINASYAITTSEGQLFLKLNTAKDFPEMFAKEAEGLKALQQASLLKIPAVVAMGELEDKQYLLLEMLEKAQPSIGFWDKFAEGLASLHHLTNNTFGFTSFNYIGSLVQQNNMCKTWAEFYATERIMPLVKKLFNNHSITINDVNAAEKLCNNLQNIFPVEASALLHGDLWAGNFMAVKTNEATQVTASIYDPAVYYGHREMDIGMSSLFGGFDNRFYEAYHHYYPLEKDWRKRVSLTQLYPLLVHAILFGGGYISRCSSILHDWK